MRLIRANYSEKQLKNERFISAVDHLIAHKYINGQKELCELIGVAESTLSNVRSNKKMVSDKTIYKMLDAFPGTFNIEYFQLKPVCMLVEDSLYYKKHPNEDPLSSQYIPYDERKVEQVAEPLPEYHAVPAWADSLIQLVVSQTKAIEDLRRELSALREEINQLKK